jgi:phenylacetate-CoA ligase
LIAEAVYRHLPIGLQTVACSAAGWMASVGRNRGRCRTLTGDVLSRLQMDPGSLAAFRDGRLRDFVAAAVRTVPFYERLFRDLRLRPDDIVGLDDMRKIPVLTKATVSERSSEFIACNARHGDFTRRRHADPVALASLPWTREARWERAAVQLRFERRHGIAPGTWCAYFGGTNVVPTTQTRPPFWRIDWPGRRVIFSPYHLSEQTVETYADALNSYQCPWLHGNPDVLAALAGVMSAARLTVDYPVPWITTTGERLLGVQRRTLSRMFGAVPKRSYIDPLGAASVTERPDGTLVIDQDYAAVELLPTADPGTYQLVGTNLSNTAAPLLRYDTGVTVWCADAPADSAAPRIVSSLDGPSYDLVTLPSGARIGRLERMFDDLPQVHAARILQHAGLTIDIDIVMIPGHAPEEARSVLGRITGRCGSAVMRVCLPHAESRSRSPCRCALLCLSL